MICSMFCNASSDNATREVWDLALEMKSYIHLRLHVSNFAN